jgi:pilus assembly protein Flp/PilA
MMVAAKPPDLLPVKRWGLGSALVHDNSNAKRILTWAGAVKRIKLEKQMNKLMRFVKDESGATAIEYGLLAAGIGLLLVVIVPQLGNTLFGIFTDIDNGIGGGAAPPAAP